jgi:hypothetical protein
LAGILDVKMSKDKYQKNWQAYWMWKCRKISIKKIDRHIECENIGYRNSERIYDEWGSGHTTGFFFDIFTFDIFPFHTTWINPNHLN